MPFKKNKCLAKHRRYGTKSKRNTKMFPSSGLERLQSICIDDAASASTSKESILLLEGESSHNVALDVRYPDMKNNNKCDNTSITLDKSDESYVHKNKLLHTSSNLQDFISIEVNDKRSDSKDWEINIGRENVARRSEASSSNKVPESCKLVTLQSTVHKTELIPEYPSRRANLHCTPKKFSRRTLLSSVKCEKPGTSSVEANDTDILATFRDNDASIVHNLCRENNVNLIDNENVPEKNKRDFQQGKIDNHIVSNNFSRLTINEIFPDNEILRNQEAKKVENGVTALPAKPTRSLPSDSKASIEDNNKSRSAKVKNKLLNLTQSFTEKMQLTTTDNDSKSSEERVEPVIKKQTSCEELNISETTTENNDSQNEVVHEAARAASETNVKNDEQNELPVISPVKRKRGRPRKVINNSVDGSTPSKSKDDDTSRGTSDIVAESLTRNKRRTNTVRTTSINDLSDESDTAEDTSFVVRKRGRPPGSRGRGGGRGRGRGRGRGASQSSLDAEYIPRLTAKDDSQLKMMKSDNIDDTGATATSVANIGNATDSNASNIEKPVQLVACAKCNQEMPMKRWSLHNLQQHNNMAWQKGEEPMDFENDEKLLKRVLAVALKRKKKFLTCEKCEAAKRSVNGFISHMQFCGKNEEERQALMVTCPICDAIMMPSSMEVHERYHRQLEQNKDKETNLQIEKTKRKAAERAVPRILKLSESTEEKNLSMNDVIRTPERKKLPNVWKIMWKKELASKGAIASCKQLGCTFTCSSYETICEHYYACKFAPQEKFLCKICKFSADSKDEIANHITEAHSVNDDFEKYSDYEIEEDESSSDESIPEYSIKRKYNRRLSKINSENTKIYKKMSFLNKETTQNPQSTEPYKPAIRWTLEFELKNYELALFKDDMPNCFTLLGDDDAVATYFPELTISMAFKSIAVNSSVKNSDNDDWKRMRRFEGDICETVPTFFVGGPVWALAWLPIPSPMYSKNPKQYIAISTHPTMESEYIVGSKHSGPNIIQIWDVGPLDHNINSVSRPVLAYAITHNSGTVWCLEWCPSGCYQDIDLGNCKMDENKPRRMGLLAAACSDGCINIYSLPFADELKFEKTEYNSWPIYKTEPVIKLIVNILMYDADEQNWQCTKLSWTKEHGHSVIAAGFSNGYIGLWHLTTTSIFSLTRRDNTKFIDAFQHFFAHHNAITMIALIPYEKNRFFASASVDKSYKFWDLENIAVPQTCLKKGIVANGVWMTHWPCAVLSFDDALGYHYMHSLVVPLREYGYKYCPILVTNSPTYGLAVSDYANSIAHGTSAGEVTTIFPHQLLYPDKTLLKKRQLNSFIETVDFLEQQHSKDNESKEKKSSKEYHYMPESYNECKDRFGIIFRDNLLNLKKNLAKGKQRETLNNDKMKSIPIEQYAYTSVNRLAWNPNAWSYLWLATGYQNGLVRLLNFSSMSTPRELNTQLPAHVEAVLAKREGVD